MQRSCETRSVGAAQRPQKRWVVAHSMISVAGTIGAVTLSGDALALQNAIRSGPPEIVPPILDRFRDHHGQVLASLRGRFQTVP